MTILVFFLGAACGAIVALVAVVLVLDRERRQ